MNSCKICGNKIKNIKGLPHKSEDELKKEIDKYVIVCSNCHRKLHKKDVI